jgi:ufm1-conjugating enzyme 1
MDNQVKSTLQKIPLLTVKAGPRDGDEWIARLKQEYKALIEVRLSRGVPYLG